MIFDTIDLLTFLQYVEDVEGVESVYKTEFDLSLRMTLVLHQKTRKVNDSIAHNTREHATYKPLVVNQHVNGIVHSEVKQSCDKNQNIQNVTFNFEIFIKILKYRKNL